MARRSLSGVLLVGGESRRFGTPKALAIVDGETLAVRGHRVLSAACDEVLVMGKSDELPFDVIDDGVDVRVPMAGVIGGLRTAAQHVVVFLPVDCPLVTVEVVRALGEACRDAAVPQRGPLPGAWAKSALPVLERRLADGRYGLMDAYEELDVVWPEIDQSLVLDADTPEDLARLT